MKKFLLCLLAISILLASCSDNSGNNSVIAVSKPVPAAGDGAVNFDTLDIAFIDFTDLSTGESVRQTDKNLLEEFRSLVLNQTYTAAIEDWEDSHNASILDSEGNTLLKLTMGGRSVTFDRNTVIGGLRYEKGKTYETGEWVYEYIRRFSEGAALDPVYIGYPAKLRIPAKYFSAEMLNEGSGKINKYETLTALHAFIGESLAGRDVEIVGNERLYGDEAMRAEAEREGTSRVIRIDCESNRGYLYINSSNNYEELVDAYSISVYKDAGNAGPYRLAAGREVFLLKADEAFDKAFNKLFDNDLKTVLNLNAGDVERLFEQKKPWFMEYICSNLGMEPWNRREDDTLVRSRATLDKGNPYTVLNISNGYNTRLLFFDGKSGAFVDYIDFGGRQSGTGFTVERTGGYAWIVGSRNRGHGTGEDINNREWYTVDSSGKKLALSIPYNVYQVGPYGGSIFNADRIQLVNEGAVRLTVDYSLTRVYMLDIPKADEYGQVNVTAEKNAEFLWDAGKRIFTSQYTRDERGMTEITPECTGITEKCGAILEEYFESLEASIKALDSIENNLERVHKAGALKQFLGDCPDGVKKTALVELLSKADPDGQK